VSTTSRISASFIEGRKKGTLGFVETLKEAIELLLGYVVPTGPPVENSTSLLQLYCPSLAIAHKFWTNECGRNLITINIHLLPPLLHDNPLEPVRINC
jgi:hypothetical protein